MKAIVICLLAATVPIDVCWGVNIVEFTPNMLAVPFAKAERAEYPPNGDRRRLVPQSATFILHIDPKNGQVQSITIEKPAGDRLFTAAWLQALVTWKFKPNRVVNVRVPVMSLSGLRVGPTRGPGMHTYVP